jgi:hypothetical protein
MAHEMSSSRLCCTFPGRRGTLQRSSIVIIEFVDRIGFTFDIVCYHLTPLLCAGRSNE